MAGRRIEIHPAALAELKSAVEWYLERSEPAAQEFVAAVDHAIALESRRRDVGWPESTAPANSSCSVSLSRSHTGRRIPAYKSLHSLMDTGAPDTGRNDSSGQEHRAKQGRVKAPTVMSKSTTLGWATRHQVWLIVKTHSCHLMAAS